MLPQVLEEMNSLPFEATPAVEGEVKQLDPVALDGCLSTGNAYTDFALKLIYDF